MGTVDWLNTPLPAWIPSPHYEVDNGGEEEDYADHSSDVGQCTNASGSHVLEWDKHI